MSSEKNRGPEPEMRDEYDFSNGVRANYADRVAKGSNVIVLDPDVPEVFGLPMKGIGRRSLDHSGSAS